MQVKTKKEVQAFFAKALCSRLVFIKDEEVMPDDLFDKLFKYVDINQIPDNILLNDERFKNRVNWSLIERFKLIRLLARDITILEDIDIEKYNYELMEIYPLLLIYPELVDYFKIDFDSLNWNEAIKMLQCDNNFIDRIDLTKYSPNKSQSLEVVKSFYNNEKIISNINLKNLDDHFVVRKLLKKTGDKYIENLNLSTLKATDWLSILLDRPELLEHCNLLLFETNDCYNLLKLIVIFPHLSYMIEENKEKISGLGWEKLIIRDYEKYEKMCQWERLSKKNWDNIIERRPELEPLKRKYIFD